jgi:glutathione S-transferase
VLLYDAAISGNAWKVRQLLAHLGIDYETREVDVIDRSDRVEVLGALNPALRLPVMLLDDGTVLSESDAILLHFAEGTPYLPDEPASRTEVLRWLFFEQSNHQPYLAMAWFLKCVLPGKPDAHVLGFLHLMGKMALKAMEQHLATTAVPYFIGEQYTVADIALYPYVARAEEAGFDLERYGALRAWLARIEAQPGFITPVTKVAA